MDQNNVRVAKQNVNNLWREKQEIGLERALEKVEAHIKEVLAQKDLGQERFDIVFILYSQLLRYLPKHRPALAYVRSYGE